MKKILLSLLIVLSSTMVFAQSHDQMVCRLGFNFEISKSANWGKGKPVVNLVDPASAACKSGVKQGDIIEEINGKSVYGMNFTQVKAALNPAGEDAVVLTIKNIESPSEKILIKKDCKLEGTITEDQLAEAFSMYSLETTTQYNFTCPFKLTVTNDNVDFSNFHTFAFASLDPNNRQLETGINNAIKKELLNKGLTVNTKNPDLTIQTFYYFDKNPNYKGTSTANNNMDYIYRYDTYAQALVRLPFLQSTTKEADAPYLMQLGVRMIDQQIVPGRIIWECEANEMLSDSYHLEDYVRIHIPLMFMQYPYYKYKNNVPYHANIKKYNYTGIVYDINRLDDVVDIDVNGPAYFSGIRQGDIIEKIGKQKMDHSAEEFSEAYKHFISYTMSLRDPKTMYTDANGFTYCMHWNPMHFGEISDAMKQSSNMAGFAYLFNYAPYINLSGVNECTFTVKRGKDHLDAIVRPEIRSSATIEIK